MPTLIKSFSDGSILEYAQGNFDNWCIYLRWPQGKRIAPRDVDYFNKLILLSNSYGKNRIYEDFVAIYERTDQNLNSEVLEFITILSRQYHHSAIELDILFTIVYAGMVAEENKQYAKLKKRIKRLGMHQILMENLTAVEAASFSRGRPWRELDKECSLRGF